MTNLEPRQPNEVEPNHTNPLRKVAAAVLHIARFLPEQAPEAMSEHYDHAQKRNDPSPPVDVEHYR